MKDVDRYGAPFRGLGRGGMLVGLRDTLREQAERGSLDPTVGTGVRSNTIRRVTTDDEILEQWEEVSEAWGDDFAAYLRYIGYTERG